MRGESVACTVTGASKWAGCDAQYACPYIFLVCFAALIDIVYMTTTCDHAVRCMYNDTMVAIDSCNRRQQLALGPCLHSDKQHNTSQPHTQHIFLQHISLAAAALAPSNPTNPPLLSAR